MNRIKELRNKKDMSQKELAEYLNVSQQSISFYENGDRDPDTEALKKLSSLFRCSIDYILGHSDYYIADTDEKANQLAKDIIQLMIDKGIIKDGEDIPDEQVNRIYKIVNAAIDMERAITTDGQ